MNISNNSSENNVLELSPGTPIYRIKNWEKHYETAASRRIKKGLSWIPVTTNHESRRFRRLMRLEGRSGVEVFGAWMLILEVAAKCPVRGLLADSEGQALDAVDLEDMTGGPARVFEEAFEVLSSDHIGWLEICNTPAADAQQKQPKVMQEASIGLNREVTRGDADSSETSSESGRSAADQYENAQMRSKSEAIYCTPAADAQQKQPKAHPTEDEDENEKEIRKRSDEEPETNRARSDVESDWKPRSRSGGRQVWLVAAMKLSRSESGSAQWRADKTSALRLFDDWVWPDHIDDAEAGNGRLRRSVEMAVRAADIKPKPMAWLTTAIKREFAPEECAA